MLIEAIVSRLQGKVSNTSPAALRLTAQQSLAIAQVEAEGDEATRAGQRFHIFSSGATGIAPVQALPTTIAQWLLYNPDKNDTIWIDVLGAWLISGTAGAGGTLLFALCGSAQLPATPPVVSAAGIVIGNANPLSNKSTKIIVASNQTLAANPGWAPLAFMNPAGTLLGQTQMDQRDVKGRIGLSPGTALALAVVSPVGTTPLFAPYGTIRDYPSDME